MRGGCCCLAIVIVAGAAVVSLAQAPVRASGPAALGAAQAPAPAPAQAVALQVGDAAPDFALPGSDGQTYRLADYRGVKPVVLAWFPKGPIRE